MMYKSDCTATLLITIIVPVRSEWIKLTKTSDFKFLKLILAIWRELFFINLAILSLSIRMMICFLDSLLVIIWICGLAFGLLLTILWIWSIFLVLRVGKLSLILIISDVLISCLEACMYDLVNYLETLAGLMFLKNLEIWLISFCNLAVIGNGIFLMLARVGLSIDLLFPLDGGEIFKVNFAKIFYLREFEFLLAMSEFYLA